jgi:hypothetical protein
MIAFNEKWRKPVFHATAVTQLRLSLGLPMSRLASKFCRLHRAFLAPG